MDLDRFWTKVASRDSGCWEWTACRRNGYGKLRVADRTRQAHRVAFELSIGPIPEGMLVCHHCDNPPCCNPAHLFLGTKSDNARDMIQKGRHWTVRDPAGRPTGGNAHRARLSASDVEQIFALRAAGWTQRAIARAVGTAQGHVSRILAGQCWPDMKAG